MEGMGAALLYTMGALVVCAGAYIYKSTADSPALPAAPEVPDMPDRDLKAELTEFRNALARLHEMASRHDERTEDAFRDINRRVDRIERGVERIENHQETEARIGSALARMGRVGE